MDITKKAVNYRSLWNIKASLDLSPSLGESQHFLITSLQIALNSPWVVLVFSYPLKVPKTFNLSCDTIDDKELRVEVRVHYNSSDISLHYRWEITSIVSSIFYFYLAIHRMTLQLVRLANSKLELEKMEEINVTEMH